MKKFISLILIAVMLFSFAACGGKNPDTVGYNLLDKFESIAKDKDALSIAEALITDESIPFMGGAMPIAEGDFLQGFGEAQITGFEEAAMFAPMIGSIAFVGYVFDLKDDVNVKDFIATLEDNADLRWNICVTADEMVTGNVDDKVFFIMCPSSFEEGGEGEE
ncbi:MAG: hypothetical protein IJC68_04305 [Firmicutes bacterium]|nr:hypothetical protein [Bacillota bacterium]